MSSTSFQALEPRYHKLLQEYKVKQSWQGAIDRAARKLLSGKDRYKKISDITGVPWEVIAVIHQLEGDGNWGTHLANGDSLKQRTHNAPAGRIPGKNPPYTWKEGAIDALTMHGVNSGINWTDEYCAYFLEKYNGMGYIMHHSDVNSPYLWSGTTVYHSGKYVSDGDYSSSAVSEQTGAIPIIMRLREIDVPDHVIEQASRKIVFLKRVKKAVYTTGAGWFTLDTLNIAPDFMAKIEHFTNDNKIMVALVSLGVVITIFEIIKNMTIGDAKDGRYVPSGLAPTVDSPDHEPAVKAPVVLVESTSA